MKRFLGQLFLFAATQMFVATAQEIQTPVCGIFDNLPQVFKFAGDPTGGEVRLIIKGLSAKARGEVVVVQTVEADTLATLVLKFVAAINANHGTITATSDPAYPEVLLITGITDNLRFTSTDAGLKFPEGAKNLTATLDAGKVLLTWVNPDSGYDRIKVIRNGTLITEFDGDKVTHTDSPKSSGKYVYEIIGVKNNIRSIVSSVTVEIP